MEVEYIHTRYSKVKCHASKNPKIKKSLGRRGERKRIHSENEVGNNNLLSGKKRNKETMALVVRAENGSLLIWQDYLVYPNS